MKTKLAICMVLWAATALVSNAQGIVWATKVEKFSSQVGEKAYAAKQVLGKPNSTPDSTGNGWQPYGSNKEESITVSFDTVIQSKQVLIIESMNTGYIRKVSAFNEDGLEYDIAAYPPKSGAKGPKLIQINVEQFSIKIKSVKVTLVPLRNVPVTIDAIGITASDKPYTLNKTNLHLEPVAAK